jgi:hypothetical protein
MASARTEMLATARRTAFPPYRLSPSRSSWADGRLSTRRRARSHIRLPTVEVNVAGDGGIAPRVHVGSFAAPPWPETRRQPQGRSPALVAGRLGGIAARIFYGTGVFKTRRSADDLRYDRLTFTPPENIESCS